MASPSSGRSFNTPRGHLAHCICDIQRDNINITNMAALHVAARNEMARALGQHHATVGFIGSSHMRDTYRKIGDLLRLDGDIGRGIPSGYEGVCVRGGMTARMYNTTVPASRYPAPDVKIIWLGANDCNPWNDDDYTDCQYVVFHLKQIIQYWQLRGCRCYFISVVPMRVRPRGTLTSQDYWKRANKVNRHMFRYMRWVRDNSFIRLPSICRNALAYKSDGCHFRDSTRYVIAHVVVNHILGDLRPRA